MAKRRARRNAPGRAFVVDWQDPGPGFRAGPDGDHLVWKEILKAGAVYRDADDVIVIPENMLSGVVEAFDAGVLAKVPITSESHFDDRFGMVPPVATDGWIAKLAMRGQRLFAGLDVREPAIADKIDKGLIGSCSVFVWQDHADRRQGSCRSELRPPGLAPDNPLDGALSTVDRWHALLRRPQTLEREDKVTEAKQAQQQSVIITPAQRHAIDALRLERTLIEQRTNEAVQHAQEMMRRAEEQTAKIVEAFQEQGRILALVHGLPHGDGWTYRFEAVDVDGDTRVKLIAEEQVPGPEPEQPPVEEPDQGPTPEPGAEGPTAGPAIADAEPKAV
jgi:hypothetical protein